MSEWDDVNKRAAEAERAGGYTSGAEVGTSGALKSGATVAWVRSPIGVLLGVATGGVLVGTVVTFLLTGGWDRRDAGTKAQDECLSLVRVYTGEDNVYKNLESGYYKICMMYRIGGPR